VLLARVDGISSASAFRRSNLVHPMTQHCKTNLETFMAETNCVECGRLHNTYNAATIRYMKFYECTSNTRDVHQANQLFTEMNDAMLAFKSHQKTHLPLEQSAERLSF
jgi:hypothetical protein